MAAISIFCFFCGSAAVAVVAYYLCSLPMRRMERARFLLDQIESALTQGQSIEGYLLSVARTRDPAISVRFQMLAAHIESGNSLIAALERVPQLLPPQIVAMLKVGEKLGDFRRVLPACREMLQDGISQSRALINYEVAIAFILNPIVIALPFFLLIRIVPVFNAINSSLGIHMSASLAYFIRLAPIFAGIELLAVVLLYLFAAVFLGGPRFVTWVDPGIRPAVDWAHMRLAWRRKRMQRDFSAMLALLLDSEVPEERAVTLAAASTANSAFIRIGQEVVERLRSGIKLPDALGTLDVTGEFRWRLENGARGAGGFFRALKGWHESLSANAYRQEQAAAQTITTGLVLLNAGTVALAAFGIFQTIAQFTPLTLK